MKRWKSLTAALCAAVLLCGFSVPSYAYADGGAGSDYGDPTMETPAPAPEPTIEPGQGFSEEGGFVTRDLLYDENTNKQFITVHTSGGATFYFVIDYDKPVDEEGEQYETYFLNVVDEADLLAAAEAAGVEQAVCSCPEKCAAGAVNTDCPVCSVNMTECAGKEAVPEPDDAPPEKEKSNAGGLVIFLVVTLLAGGGVGVAGVDDDGAGLALFQDLAVKDDRSCAELVRGEAGRAGAGQVGVENSDVGLLVLALFDGGVDRAGGEALRRGNAALDLFQIGHVGGSPLLTLV